MVFCHRVAPSVQKKVGEHVQQIFPQSNEVIGMNLREFI